MLRLINERIEWMLHHVAVNYNEDNEHNLNIYHMLTDHNVYILHTAYYDYNTITNFYFVNKLKHILTDLLTTSK